MAVREFCWQFMAAVYVIVTGGRSVIRVYVGSRFKWYSRHMGLWLMLIMGGSWRSRCKVLAADISRIGFWDWRHTAGSQQSLRQHRKRFVSSQVWWQIGCLATVSVGFSGLVGVVGFCWSLTSV